MTRVFAEILLFASIAINAALLIFIAGVLRKITDDMPEQSFKFFIDSMVRYSSKSPFMLIILNIPFLGAIPYFYFYGFGHYLILFGITLWLIAGIISKLIKLPIYKAIANLENTDLVHLREERKKMNAGNILQAILYSLATIIMAASFMNK